MSEFANSTFFGVFDFGEFDAFLDIAGETLREDSKMGNLVVRGLVGRGVSFGVFRVLLEVGEEGE